MTADPAPALVSERQIDLSGADRIWAIGSIFGAVGQLEALHDSIGERFSAGDRIVYLGNVYGCGDVRATLTEILRFRTLVLAQRPLYMPNDIAYLRGAQEEMWHKLLQIHFAPKPKDLLDWMMARGVDSTLRAFGGDPAQAHAAAGEGMVALTRWTGRLKAAMQAAPGHQPWFNHLRRYAHSGPGGALFVSAGIDPERALHEQRDAFWWANRSFSRVPDTGYQGYRRVIRGFDPDGAGWSETQATLTIDGGCGRGGSLIAVCLSPDGQIVDRVDAEPISQPEALRLVR